jgi:hypothetical protein
VERGATGGVSEGCRQKGTCRACRQAGTSRQAFHAAYTQQKTNCECSCERSKLNQEESGLPFTHLRER